MARDHWYDAVLAKVRQMSDARQDGVYLAVCELVTATGDQKLRELNDKIRGDVLAARRERDR